MNDPHHDPLLDRLRELPVREPSSARGRDPMRAARAALAEGPSANAPLRALERALVPIVLASVVGLYLSWAFSAVIALNH